MTDADAVPTGFLGAPPASDAAQRLYEADVADLGFVMNNSRMWAHAPALHDQLFELLTTAADVAGLTLRQRGILVAACASTKGDSYCSLAWGTKLAAAAGPEVSAGVLTGEDSLLDAPETALATWARRITRDANSAGPADVQELREAGYDDAQILAITAFVAGRIAYSTVNDALGALPDEQFTLVAPAAVRRAVTYGRPIAAPGD